MAGLLQLDKAASLAGKSEVTLRRLIKAGKIPFKKEKTLTGFIYMVDPEAVKAFYAGKPYEAPAVEEPELETPAASEEVEIRDHEAAQPIPTNGIRVAVAGETGSAYEYWQKKADLYEDRYNQEVVKHAQAREELGVWRGRAEQSQAMVMKLLPGGQEGEVKPATQSAPLNSRNESNWLVTFLLIVLIAVIIGVGALFYLKVF